jgi:hypothetical protein
MSTPCKLIISESYPISQVLHEISWLEQEIRRVEDLMKKRPSKQRHWNDLQRQLQDRKDILKRQ